MYKQFFDVKTVIFEYNRSLCLLNVLAPNNNIVRQSIF